jgi:hypothetical protein
MGQHGTYVFTRKELERALDRENFGVKGEVLSEGNFAEVIDEWYQGEPFKGCDLWLKKHTCEECIYVGRCAEYK